MEELLKYNLKKHKLRFSGGLEKQFADYNYKRILPVIRISLITAFILSASFGVLDAFNFPESKYLLWFIRYAVISPAAVIVFIFSFFKYFEKTAQLQLSLVPLIFGFGIIAMMACIKNIQMSLYYYAGLTLVVMWTYTFARLKFINATIVSTVIIAAYNFSIIFFWGELTFNQKIIAFVNNNFFMITTYIIGMFACYYMEIYTRRVFLQRLLIIEHEKRSAEEKKMLITLSITDHLTSAYNRRYFINTLNSEINRSNRYHTVFSLIMFDIDHFKNINDIYGHDAGDEVLRGLVEMMQKRIRKNDVLARWGGEEFMILLTVTSLENAKLFAEKLNSNLRDMEFKQSGKITASFGVTEYILEETKDTLLKRVDELVYKAKKEGRNCVRYSK